ncbi:MAG: dUTP diphosphatase [Hyphomicrobium sp.]|uniref:dUTP diphosphatase n=1 Tax=Hyphomicrobium sp. TaxID=82 RepID=UPI0035692353
MIRRPEVKKIKVNVQRLQHAADLPLPAYQTAEAAGFDLVAAVPAGNPITLSAGGSALIPTGLIFELPPGNEAQVRPRSGLAAKFGITVLNSPGTIDSDYRGEVSVILINLGKKPFTVNRGERVAQMIIAPIVRADLEEVAQVTGTKRGTGGFGSTGIKTSTSSPKTKKQNVVAKKLVNKKSKFSSKKSLQSR